MRISHRLDWCLFVHLTRIRSVSKHDSAIRINLHCWKCFWYDFLILIPFLVVLQLWRAGSCLWQVYMRRPQRKTSMTSFQSLEKSRTCISTLIAEQATSRWDKYSRSISSLFVSVWLSVHGRVFRSKSIRWRKKKHSCFVPLKNKRPTPPFMVSPQSHVCQSQNQMSVFML